MTYAEVTVDGKLVGEVVHGFGDTPSEREDNSLASQLGSVWVAWTSCTVWGFEDQKRWIEGRLN